jgi:hypothetical protein
VTAAVSTAETHQGHALVDVIMRRTGNADVITLEIRKMMEKMQRPSSQ